MCRCDDFILPRSDSNGGVDDSKRDKDEGDNKVFVPVGGGPLRGWEVHWTLRWLPLPVVTHALLELSLCSPFNPASSCAQSLRHHRRDPSYSCHTRTPPSHAIHAYMNTPVCMHIHSPPDISPSRILDILVPFFHQHGTGSVTVWAHHFEPF